MSIMETEILSEPLVLAHCYGTNRNAVDALAGRIHEKGIRHILIAARGSSNNASVFFKYLCEVYTDLRVSFVYPSSITLYGGRLKGDDSMLLAVSQGGQGKDLQIMLDNAKENGVFTVSITNDTDSPLAVKADCSLCMELPKELSMAATKSFSAEMVLLYMLACALSGRSYNAMEQLAPALDAVAAQKEKLYRFADKLMGVDNMFVLSRGYGLALAKEACCKLQETCLVNATPYASSDFLHGPFALVDRGTKVLMPILSDEGRESNIDMLDRILEQGGEVFILTQEQELIKRYGGLLLPTVDRELEIFSFAMAIQLICSALSEKKGLNADTSRNLNKYTVTV